MTTPRRPALAGFTFIELTCVWMIILVLAAILFPVFARAREKAYQANCMNNLVNIGIALRVYAGDYAGHYPPVDNDLSPLVPNYLPEPRTLLCPSAVRLRAGGALKIPPEPKPGQSDYVYQAGWCDDDRPNVVFAADDRDDRHNGGANYLFTDGRGRWLSVSLAKTTGNEGFAYDGMKALNDLRIKKLGSTGETPPQRPVIGGARR